MKGFFGRRKDDPVVQPAAEIVVPMLQSPPKVDSKMESIHVRVKKQIIKHGRGGKPYKGSVCTLHYREWIKSNQHKLVDTWHEGIPIKLVIGKEKKEMRGLGIGSSSMKAGEHALLHVGWEVGYGKEGNSHVSPMADLVYEVEVISIDENKAGKTSHEKYMEEWIKTADGLKMEGNALFKDGKLEEAMQQYERAISLLANDFMLTLRGNDRDWALAVKNPCHLNMAACLLKLERYENAITHCGIVLAEDRNNAKALFRRGKANIELGRIDAARADFLKARKFAPEDNAVAKELQSLAEHDQKQKDLFKGMFGPSNNVSTYPDPEEYLDHKYSSYSPKTGLTRRHSTTSGLQI